MKFENQKRPLKHSRDNFLIHTIIDVLHTLGLSKHNNDYIGSYLSFCNILSQIIFLRFE